MQVQRASLKRSASGAFARQQEVKQMGTRLAPHQPQSSDLPSSPDKSNSHGYAAPDQYQYPTQADLLRHMPPNLESTDLLNEYLDQGHPYFEEQVPCSPAASKTMRYIPESQMDMVKYNNNNIMGVPGYEMKAPSQGYPSQEDDLDQQALRAKRDAEAKRKQIPPFVQKLSR